MKGRVLKYMNFSVAFDRLMGHEGSYTPGRGDPGGETNWGISKRSYPHLNIKWLTRKTARDIYERDFWHRIDADKLSDGMAFQVFDTAVNSGIETAVRMFQRALGVADDGHFGPESRKAAKAVSDTDQIMRFNAERLDFMRKLKNWPQAGRGWAGRIAKNLRYGSEDS